MLTQIEIDALILSAKVSVWSVGIGLPLAVWTAWVLATKEFRGKTLVSALIHAPLVIPPVVVGYLLLLSFGPTTPIGGFLESVFGGGIAFSWRGAAFAAGIMGFPLMVRAVRIAFEVQNPRMALAARTLGASKWRAFFTISVPLAMPGIIAGGVLGFARALGEFGATITFVSNISGLTQTLPLALYSAIQVPGGETAAARLLALSLTLAIAALVASEVIARRYRKAIA